MLPWSAPITRVRGLSPSRFRLEHLVRARPVILEDAITHWPALSSWTLEGLRQRAGQRPVTTYRIRQGHLHFEERRGIVPEMMLLNDFLDELEGSRPLEHRVRSVVEHELPELLTEIDIPEVCPRLLGVETNLWISGPQTYSRLHFDQPHNLLAQVRGEKRVVIIPATERRFVYPNPLGSSIAQFSQVDLRALDLSRFPKLRRTHPLEGILRPGDALFIPSGAWHYLEAEDMTISVGFRWWPVTRLPLVFAADIYKRLRGFTR